MKITFTFYAFLLLFDFCFPATLEGEWIAGQKDDCIKLTLMIDNDEPADNEWQSSFCIKKESFSGLNFNSENPFSLVRDAGEINFTGKLTESKGIGSFTFTANESYIQYLKENGYGTVEDKELLLLCLADINKNYIADLKSLGFSDIEVSDLVSCAVFNLSIDFITQFQRLGYTDLIIQNFITFKIHGVDRDYIEYIIDSRKNKDTSPQKIIEYKIHDF